MQGSKFDTSTYRDVPIFAHSGLAHMKYIEGLKNNYRDLEDVHTSYFKIGDNYSDQNGVANVSKTASAIISCFK